MIKTFLTKHLKLVVGVTVLTLASLSAFGYYWTHRQVELTIGIYAGSSWDVPNGNDYKVIDKAIKRFEKAHPNVTVTYESGISKSDYSNWLSDRIIEGEQPDVFIVPEDDFNLLSSTGALASLTKDVKDIDTSIFYQSSYLSGQYDHNQYALPFESNPTMMCINKDLLAKEGITIPESGWTLEEFYEICQQVTKDTDGDGVIDQYGCVGYTWQEAVAAYDTDIFNNSGTKANLNTSKVKSALTLVSQLNTLSGNYQVTSNDFDEGKVAFLPMTLAQYRTYMPYPYHVAKYSTFSWTCVQMPSATGKNNASQVSTSLFAISSKSKYHSLAWEFLQLLCADDKTQQYLFEMSQGASVLKSVMNSSETDQLLQADDFGSDALTLSNLDDMLSDAVTKSKFKSYNKAMEQANYLITQAIANNSIDSDLTDIQQQIEEELE